LQHRYAAPLALMRHGFKVWEGGLIVAQVMEPILSSPLPVPKGPYVDYPNNGPRKAVEIALLCLDEPAFNLVFGALSISHENGIARLVIDGMNQLRAGHAKFSTPVIKIAPQLCNYRKYNKQGWAFGHKLVDYISNDCKTLWSKVKQVEDPAELPWDAGDGEGTDKDAGEKL
jgi:hypothetical protein